MRRPEHVAALGYGAASALLTLAEDDLLTREIAHLSGREFFAPGRPLRFEVDGIALLGVSLGVAAHAKDNERQWLKDLLARSTNDISGDPWQLGLLRAAQQSIGEFGLRIVPPDLAVAMVAKGIGVLQGDDLEAGWKMAVRLEPHNSGPARNAIRLTVFENVLARVGQIAIAAVTKDDLISLLQNISRSMRLSWDIRVSQPDT